MLQKHGRELYKRKSEIAGHASQGGDMNSFGKTLKLADILIEMNKNLLKNYEKMFDEGQIWKIL